MTEQQHEFKVPKPHERTCAWVVGKDAQGKPIYCGIPRDKHWRKPIAERPERLDGP